MNLKDINVFKTVAEVGNVTKASKQLYMTPQGVSKIIKNLELECDCEFFVRMNNRMDLTECGRHFYEYAIHSMEEYRDMRNNLLHIKQKESGVVDLLSAYGILRLVTPECITAFRQKYPDIVFHYRECPDKQIERWFQAQEGNVAFSLADCNEDLYDILVFESFPIKLLVNRNHPLSTRKSVTIHDLRDEPLYIESQEFKIHDKIVNKCREAGFEPNIVFETSGFSLCHKMVKENKGISVTVDFISDDMKRDEDDLVLIPFSDAEGEEYLWKICMLTRKGETPGNGVDLFQKHVKEWIDDIQSGRIKR